uniref:Uncharacterized protein n=1 Tax=Salix viminalis TaxID=40686 RepID=A0A6N2LN83_SALVM
MVAAALTTPQIINLVCLDVIKTSGRACQDTAPPTHPDDVSKWSPGIWSLSVVASSWIIYSELQRIRIGELLSE